MRLDAIASTALSASALRLSTSAHNVANMMTPEFKPLQVTQEARQSGGVDTQVTQSRTEGVDLAQEIVEQRLASVSYSANLKVLSNEDDLLGTVIDLIR